MNKSNLYPIAETFDSLQGEGGHAGVRMHFIRLAGCNVGVYSRPSVLAPTHPDLAILREAQPEHSICTSALGTSFLCDTNYKVTTRKSAMELITEVQARHICLTGGEPLLHDLMPLIELASPRGIGIHIETSGTLPIPRRVHAYSNVVCSPKEGFLPENRPYIREFKFVVDSSLPPEETVARIDAVVEGTQVPVYLQGINSTNDLHLGSSQYAIDIILRHRPLWRLTFQSHKLFNLR